MGVSKLYRPQDSGLRGKESGGGGSGELGAQEAQRMMKEPGESSSVFGRRWVKAKRPEL